MKPTPSNVSEYSVGSASTRIDLYQKGLNLFSQGNIQEAVITLGKNLKENTGDIRTCPVSGNIYMKADKLNDAKAVLEIGSKVDSQNPEIYLFLAHCYNRLGNKEKAIENIKKSILIYQQRKDEENFQEIN